MVAQVEVEKEVIVKIPKYQIVDRIVEVPKYEYVTVDKVVEVPRVKFVEKIVEVCNRFAVKIRVKSWVVRCPNMLIESNTFR